MQQQEPAQLVVSLFRESFTMIIAGCWAEPVGMPVFSERYLEFLFYVRNFIFTSKGKKNALPFSQELFAHCCKRVGNSEWTLGFQFAVGKRIKQWFFLFKKQFRSFGFYRDFFLDGP